MDKWFTVEKIDGDTFAISEYGHWEETHCYLLCGLGSAVLIDTGLGISNIKKVADGLTRLPITVVTTHAHWDHIGGHGYFDRIGVHEYESSWLEGSFPIPLEITRDLVLNPAAFQRALIWKITGYSKAAPISYFMTGTVLISGTESSVSCTLPATPRAIAAFMRVKGVIFIQGSDIRRLSRCVLSHHRSEAFRQSVKRVGELEISRVLLAITGSISARKSPAEWKWPLTGLRKKENSGREAGYSILGILRSIYSSFSPHVQRNSFKHSALYFWVNKRHPFWDAF